MTATQQNKREYFKTLRERWQRSKELAEQDQEALAIYREHGLKVSYTNFYLALSTMRALGWEGIPYVHCKTFKRWKESGYVVKKGEKARSKGSPGFTRPIKTRRPGKKQKIPALFSRRSFTYSMNLK